MKNKNALKTFSLFKSSILTTWLAACLLGALHSAFAETETHRVSTADDFLRLTAKPVAIGHHGLGPNTGEIPNQPLENTVESVRDAYRLGALAVEVDVQLTKDGKLAVYHDDYLEDGTCIRALTYHQLKKRLPYVPELQEVLEVAHHFNRKARGHVSGILIVELKAFSPLCDPSDELEATYVCAAIHEVRKANMETQVIFDSFSPALLARAAQMAPGIPRELDLSGLQLLTPEQVTALTGQPVRIVQKEVSLGLTWAEIGSLYRLPGYSSVQQFLQTALLVQARAVGAELNFLGPAEQQQPGSGTAFVAAAHSLGLRVFADPAGSEAEWNFFESLGVDAIYSILPLGLSLQPDPVLLSDLPCQEERRE
jgi:glycerophosphoryl diester phosphodiesterase